MAGYIFSIQNGALVKMNEERPPNEDVFQELLAQYPDLLAGDQIDPATPRRWLLVKREMAIPCEEGGGERWSLDHLFLDQDGIPTLVEVKRSTDTRIRREVVGQMLDYAANAVVYWPVEKIRAEYEASSPDAEEQLMHFLGEGGDPEQFWQKVKTNLQAGRIRMVFVADVIPPELRRIVEFLNEQMDPAEVLAVEIKQFVGEGVRTLVPRVIGQIEKTPPARSKVWDESSFPAQLRRDHGAVATEVANRLLNWARSRFGEVKWGRGAQVGTFAVYLAHKEKRGLLFLVWGWGSVSLRLNDLKQWVPFDEEATRLAVLGRLNQLPDTRIPAELVEPGVALTALQSEEAFNQFTQMIEWIVEEIRKG